MTVLSNRLYRNAGNSSVLSQVPDSAHTILDIGCGAGDNARALAEHGKVVDGVSISASEIEVAKMWCRSAILYDLEQGLPPHINGLYDVCLCSHVLEHITEPSELLRDIRSVLKRNSGMLIVALPNIMHYRFRLRLLLGRFEYTSDGVMDNTHYRWYTFASGKRLLETNGFVVRRAFSEGSFPLWKLRKVLPGAVGRALDEMACRYRPGLFGLQHIYVATPS